MLRESLVGLRRKDPRKDAVARDRIAPILDFVLRRPTPSRAPSISRFEKLSLAVLRLDNKSLRCVVVFNPGHSPSRRSEHCVFGSFVAAILGLPKGVAMSSVSTCLRLHRDFSAISRVQLPHNIAHVDFHRAQTHVQFVGDYLVRFALLDRPDD